MPFRLSIASLLLALALVPATTAQTPNPAFMQLMFDKPKMTAEQAANVEGVWDLVEDFRLDGTEVDAALLKAAAASDGKPLDFEGITQSALGSVLANNLTYRIWVINCNATSGLFWGYYLLYKPGFVDVNRLMGAAVALDDGSVLMASQAQVDTGLFTTLVKGDVMKGLWVEGLELLDFNMTSIQTAAGEYSNKKFVLDNQAVAQYELRKMPAAAVQEAQEVVVARLEDVFQELRHAA